VAGRIGYCGLDPRRSPLVGDEVRGCWTATTSSPIGLFEEVGGRF